MPLHAWLIFCTGVLARIAFGVQSFSVAAVGPDLISGLGLSYAALGTLVGVYSLPGVAVAFPSSWLAARFGNRHMMICGLVLMTAGGALMTAAAGYPVMLAGRLIAGCGQAVLTVVATKLVLDHVPAALMATLMGTFIAGYALGVALAPSVLPLLGGWRWAMGASAALCGLTLAAAIVTVPGSASSAGATQAFRLLPGTLAPLLLMSVAWALGNAAFNVFFSFLPAYFAERGMTVVQAGGLASIGLYAGLLPSPFGGWLLSRSIGLERGTLWCFMGFTISMALLPLGLDPTVVVIANGVCIGVAAGPTYAIATRDLKPNERALAMGIFMSVFYVATAAGPALAGFAQDLSHRPDMLFYVAAILSGVATLALAVHGLWRRPVGSITA